MMKKAIFTFLLCGAALCAAAQTVSIKSEAKTDDETLFLLEMLGARAWRFDLTGFSAKRYNFVLFVDEYTGGERKPALSVSIGKNWETMERSDFQNEQEREEFIRNQIRISENGKAFLRFEKAAFGIITPKNDSIAWMGVNFYGAKDGKFPLKLKTLPNAQVRGPAYDCRPFKLYPMGGEKARRMPLLLYSSFWFDEKFNVLRSCMEDEFEPDMSSESLKLIPHYYVIGLEITEL